MVPPSTHSTCLNLSGGIQGGVAAELAQRTGFRYEERDGQQYFRQGKTRTWLKQRLSGELDQMSKVPKCCSSTSPWYPQQRLTQCPAGGPCAVNNC